MRFLITSLSFREELLPEIPSLRLLMALAPRGNSERLVPRGGPGATLVARPGAASSVARGTERQRITLNLKLVQVPTPLIDYVVLHEPCHLIAPHHGRAYDDLLGKVLPDWNEKRERVNRYEFGQRPSPLPQPLPRLRGRVASEASRVGAREGDATAGCAGWGPTPQRETP